MPYGDAAEHLLTAFAFHEDLRTGNWLRPFTRTAVYAPLTPFVGGLSVFVGGRSVSTPIVAQNLLYVPALALGCFGTARLPIFIEKKAYNPFTSERNRGDWRADHH